MDATERPSFVAPLEEPENPAPARDSATVLVVRDGTAGLEVFMLERHLRSDFAGGAYVFPGGTIDDADADLALAGYVTGIGDDLRRALGDRALELVVCAIRETFEEAGILLARTAEGEPVTMRDDTRWTEYRRALNAGETTALAVARDAGIVYAGDLLRFWVRLVTPVQSPRRYDTRFFVAHMPDGQVPLHDDLETTASAWVQPLDAVERGKRGEFSIIYPTRKTLESIGSYTSTADLWTAADGRDADPITPRIVLSDGEPRIALPDGSLDLP